MHKNKHGASLAISSRIPVALATLILYVPFNLLKTHLAFSSTVFEIVCNHKQSWIYSIYKTSFTAKQNYHTSQKKKGDKNSVWQYKTHEWNPKTRFLFSLVQTQLFHTRNSIGSPSIRLFSFSFLPVSKPQKRNLKCNL